MSFTLRHLFGALILHAALFGLLAGGARCSRPPVRPMVIEAVILDPSREEVSAQKRKEQERKRREEQKRREEEQRRRQEAERKEQERQEAERKEAERQEQRRKAEAEAKTKAEAQRKEKELAQKKKAEEDARRQREEQAARDAAAREAMEQALQQEHLQRQLEREQQARKRSEQEVALNNWLAQIIDRIRRNWIRPPATAADFSCTVRVQLLPDGSVTYAKIDRGCGNPALDKSVEDAVFRSAPLPRPSDPAVFDRDLTITFTP